MAFHYDFILKNGHIYDPSTGRDEIGDLYVRSGRIVERGHDMDETAINTIDCTGQYVLPAFIEEHAHFFYDGSFISTNADILCPPAGIATAVDAGTAGFGNFPLLYKMQKLRCVTNFKAYLNLAPFGILDVPGVMAEDIDPKLFCEKEIIRMFREYSDVLVGLKLRIDRGTSKGYGLEPLRQALQIAEKVQESIGHSCPLSVHAANVPEDAAIGDIADLLRPGDIFCHVFSPFHSSSFEANGMVKEQVRRAQERGVYMDCSNGRIHWSFENYRKAIQQGFQPDLISSDVTRVSMYANPAFSLLNPMNALLQAGMHEKDIFRVVTYTAAKALDILDQAGTLQVGAPANITVVSVSNYRHVMKDWYGNTEACSRMILPLMTMCNGEMTFRQFFFRDGSFSKNC